MGDPNPFAPNPALAFLAGLTSSTMGTLKEDHDRERKEEARAKEIDYELLMAGLEQMKPNLTPSQAKEILTRATDIFKPKGHGGIKEKLHEMFGGGAPYDPQAGRILNEAAAKPRLRVDAPTQTAIPGSDGGGVRARTVTMPSPSQYNEERTFGEQKLYEEERKVGFQLEKALAVEEARDANRQEARREQNKAIVDRYREISGIKDDAKATQKLRERASIFGDPDDSTNLERARISLQEELTRKREESKAKLEYNRKRLTQIDEALQISKQRLEQSTTKAQQVKFKDDPQWKGMWAKATSNASAAKTARTQAAQMYAKFENEGDPGWLEEAKKYESIAEGLEADLQKQLDGMENRQYYLQGGVSLPNNPSGGTRRGALMVTEAEIRAAGGSDKDVQYARDNHVLAEPK